jgi:hypothetical protein
MLMVIALLISHVIVALSSIVLTTYAFVAPTKRKIYTSYAFVGLTLATGTDLVITTHTALLSACITGLFYLGVVSIGIIAAHYRLNLARQKKSLIFIN